MDDYQIEEVEWSDGDIQYQISEFQADKWVLVHAKGSKEEAQDWIAGQRKAKLPERTEVRREIVSTAKEPKPPTVPTL